MTGSETKPGQADNINVRVIKLSESDDVLKFIRIHFYPDEPMNIGSAQGHPDLEDEQFNISQIGHGSSLMAVQQETTDGILSERIVGVLLSGPKYSNEAEHLFKEAARFGSSNWGTQVGILAQAERDSNVYERYNVKRALHVHAVAVDKSLRGRAIATRLIKKFKGLGRELNYPLMTLDCTSLYSAKLAERLGMDCVNVIKYADYLDKEGKVVYKPPPPHEYLKTYAMRL